MRQFKSTASLSQGEKEALNRAVEATGKNLDEIDSVALNIVKEPTEKSRLNILLYGDDTQIDIRSAVGSYEESYKKIGAKGIKLNIIGSALAVVEKNLLQPVDNFHTIGAWVYIEDVTKVTNIYMRMYESLTVSHQYDAKSQLTSDGESLVNGWNLIRFRVLSSATYTHTAGAITSFRFMCQSNQDTTIGLGGVWIESFDKAKIIFVHDGGYEDFFNENNRGYYDLERRNMPVTIATIPNKIFANNPEYMSPSKLYELSLRNNNEISIHSFDGEDALSTMTPAEVYNESFNALSMLRQHGYNPIWRAAWFRANVPGGYGSKNLFYSFVRHGGYSVGETIESFPFASNYNARRWKIHLKTETDFDNIFNLLQKTRGVLICYTHNVNDDSTGDIAPYFWDYFLQKIDTAKTGGWLEGSTYKMLANPYLKENANYVSNKANFGLFQP